jgi:4'-phosphopantetheinyl transferase
MTPVLVARLRLDTDPSALAVATALVDAAERARAARFVRDADRARHLLGRALARTLLAQRTGVAPASLRWVADADGKPALDGPGPAFNLSHSGDWIACALAADVPVGVDVQETTPAMARPDDFGRVLGPRERARIDGMPDEAARIAAFARAWARKEALLKAVGVGLQLELDDIDIVDGVDGPRWDAPADARSALALAGAWTLRDVAVDGRHACAVAWRGGPRSIETIELDAAALGALARSDLRA